MVFELPTLLVIGTDHTGSCKSNDHMITIKMAPKKHWIQDIGRTQAKLIKKTNNNKTHTHDTTQETEKTSSTDTSWYSLSVMMIL